MDTSLSCAYCPQCGTMLNFLFDSNGTSLSCNRCGYARVMTESYEIRECIKYDEDVNILGDEEAWKDVEQISTVCPKCAHNKAYFRQMQIRSADEPSTSFMKCVSCAHQWRED